MKVFKYLNVTLQLKLANNSKVEKWYMVFESFYRHLKSSVCICIQYHLLWWFQMRNYATIFRSHLISSLLEHQDNQFAENFMTITKSCQILHFCVIFKSLSLAMSLQYKCYISHWKGNVHISQRQYDVRSSVPEITQNLITVYKGSVWSHQRG